LLSRVTLLTLIVLAVGVGAAAVGALTPDGKPQTEAPRETTAKAAEPRTDRFGDSLPAGALHRLGTERFRRAEFYSAALSPDGKTLAASSESGLSLFDVETGRTLSHRRDLPMAPGHGGDRCGLDFSPDGKCLAGVGLDRMIHIWDVKTSKEVLQVG